MAVLRRDFISALAGSMGALSAGAGVQAAPAGRNFQFDPRRQYQMPAHFGERFRGQSSARYLDVTRMGVSYLTDPDKLIQYLPAPFEVGAEARITVHYGMNREVEWLAGAGYNLLGVDAQVRFNGKVDQLEGGYCLVLWENETDPILTGRELQGIPKIYADIEDHTVIRGVWRATASHRGHKIVNTGRPGAAVSHATVFPVSSSPKQIWLGKGEVEWQRLTWEQNPTQAHIVNALKELPILEYGPAFVSKGSTNLSVPGRPVRQIR